MQWWIPIPPLRSSRLTQTLKPKQPRVALAARQPSASGSPTAAGDSNTGIWPIYYFKDVRTAQTVITSIWTYGMEASPALMRAIVLSSLFTPSPNTSF
jgi:hypothetical protein